MNKCKKYSHLISKELDGVINENELNILKEHLSICEKCKEEYELIKKVKDVLKEDAKAPLPENFKTALREKLVEYNMSKAPTTLFHKRLPVNLAATLCLTLFVTVFSLNYNGVFDRQNEDVDDSQNPVAASETGLENASVSTDVVNNNKRSLPVKEDFNAADNSVARNITAKTENAEEQKNVSHDGLINIVSNDYLTLTVDDSVNIKELISYAEVIDYGTFFVPMDKLSEVKKILKDYNITNENDETVLKDKFIIKQ